MNNPLEKFELRMSTLLGTSWAFLFACVLFTVWLGLATFAPRSENARLFIVEMTGLFVFVHLFIVQRNNNKEIKAVQVKLDEVIATMDGANNQLIKAETAPESVVEEMRAAYEDLADSIEHPTRSMSLPDAQLGQMEKKRSA